MVSVTLSPGEKKTVTVSSGEESTHPHVAATVTVTPNEKIVIKY